MPLSEGGIRRPSQFLYANKDKALGPATRILVELIKTYAAIPLDAPFAAPLPPAREAT